MKVKLSDILFAAATAIKETHDKSIKEGQKKLCIMDLYNKDNSKLTAEVAREIGVSLGKIINRTIEIINE